MSPRPVEDGGWFDERTDECCLLSEKSLAEAWNRPEEDAAWAYLQSSNEIGENGIKTAP